MRRLLMLLALSPILVSSGCDVQSLSINLHNEDVQPIHLFGPDEDFAKSNRVAPGGQRTWRTPLEYGSYTVVIYAGRNEVVLDSISCVFTIEEGDTAESQGADADLAWNGSSLVDLGGCKEPSF